MKATTTAHPHDRRVVAELQGVDMYFFDGGMVTRALENTTFDIRRGEVFGLAGPPGCGKSTTLKLLAGRLIPTSGKVKAFGRSAHRSFAKSRIGYVSSPGHVEKNKKRSHFSRLFLRKRTRADEPGIPLAKKLAQALLRKPELVLLDEPFAGLNEAECRELQLLIKSLAAAGQTVVVAGSVLNELQTVCDRIALYGYRTIAAVGTVPELLQDRDSVGLLAPILPPALLDRMLCLLRAELRSDSIQPAAAPVTATGLRDPQAKTVGTESSGNAGSVASDVDHAKLAALTKPPLDD